jgi:predicted NAD/FAD-dependent oxidoreductase
MSERDPRVDPKPGDVLQRVSASGKIESRRIIECRQQDHGPAYFVTFVRVFRRAPDSMKQFHWLKQFRKWAATAEVFRRGE